MTTATFYYIKNGKIVGEKMTVDEFKKLLSKGNSNKFNFSTLPKKKPKTKTETKIIIKPVNNTLCKEES